MLSLQEVLTSEHGLGAQLYGFTLSEAADISDDGRVIAGYGRNVAGEMEGFVAVIPEPAAAPLAFGALLVALGRSRLQPRRSRF
jgi:hypothetical protein